MADGTVIANGRPVVTSLPCTLEEFLVHQGLLPRSVVVELDGEAAAAGLPLAATGESAQLASVPATTPAPAPGA